MQTKPRAILIAGPTASGKSAFALSVAEAASGTIINADALQVYAELKILTARPGPDEMARARHALYGHVTVREAYSVARWLEHARVSVAAAERGGRMPILVGGTGLYFRAALEGLAEIPPIPEEVRDEANALFEAEGPDRFRARLAELDPVAAARWPINDRYRAMRAYEVVTATGRTLGEWHEGAHRPLFPEAATLRLALLPAREALQGAIKTRFAAMLEAGAIEEAKAVLALDLPPTRPAMKALGLAELGEHLSGRTTLEAASEAAITRTRRYAKRQMTWIRGQMTSWRRFEAQELTEIADNTGRLLLNRIDPEGTLGGA